MNTDNNRVIYSLGAVLSTNGIQAMVVGYDFIQQGEHLKLAYRIIPYPIGYNGSIKLVTGDECTLLCDGYHNDLSMRVVSLMKICDEVSEKVSCEEMNEYLSEVFLGNQVDNNG